MSRNPLLLSVLLATGVALADGPPEPEPAAPAAEPKPQAEERAGIEPAPDPAAAEPAAAGAAAPAGTDAKALDGMSVLGNQEAPKSLVIVPWKSSEIGGALGISTMLDDSRQPVDKEVFMRALSYYEIRSK